MLACDLLPLCALRCCVCFAVSVFASAIYQSLSTFRLFDGKFGVQLQIIRYDIVLFSPQNVDSTFILLEGFGGFVSAST